MEHGDYVILLLVIRHGFTIDRLVGSRAMLLGLVKMNRQGSLFVEIDLNLKHCVVYSSNQVVRFLYIKYIKARLSITTIILKIVLSLLSMKHRNKKNH